MKVSTKATALIRELQSFDWNNLGDIESIGVWPGVVKMVIAVALFVVCLGAGFWFDIRSLQAELTRWQTEESTLRSELEQKSVLAANLEEYKAQTVQMEEEFAELLRQLPSQTEVPDLVDDVTETGLGSSLTFSRIELDPVTYLARVHLSVNPAIKIPEDTAALISSESLMGGKYVSLEPGAAEDYIEDGGRIQYTQAPQNLEQLLGKFIFSMKDAKDEKEKEE